MKYLICAVSWGVLTISSLLLAGCVVGPDYKRPEFETPAQFTAHPVPSVRVTSPMVASERWWTLFDLPELDQMIERAWANSPTITQAQARFTQAEEAYRAQTGETYYPAVDASLTVNRQQIDPATMGLKDVPKPGPFTTYGLGISLAYTFDFFGGLQRTLEAMQADVDLRRYEQESAHQLLAASIAMTGIRQAALRAQTDNLQRRLALEEQQYAITLTRYRVGGVSEIEANLRQARIADIAAQLAQSQAQQEMAGHLLAIYTGVPPDQAITLPIFTLEQFRLPEALPLVLPSELLHRRPDIRASEAVLQRASAQLGVASANLFPRFTLGASATMADIRAGDVLGGGVDIWQFGTGIVQPLFHGGALQAQKRGAEALYQEALAHYRETVLKGLREVADGLQAMESGIRTLTAAREQATLASVRYRTAVLRYETGGVSRAALLAAEHECLLTIQAQNQAEETMRLNVATLMQKIAGGYVN